MPTNQRPQKQQETIRRLKNAGIEVKEGKKRPKNGRYSGLIGRNRKKIKINA